MIERDYFMRQIRQLAQVLQRVIAQREQGQVDEAHRLVRQAIGEVDERDDGELRHRPLREVIQFCRRDDAFRPDFAMRVADILNEEGHLLVEQGREREARKSYTRALLLYRRAMQAEDAALPWNTGEKLSRLEANVDEEGIRAIESLLNDETG